MQIANCLRIADMAYLIETEIECFKGPKRIDISDGCQPVMTQVEFA